MIVYEVHGSSPNGARWDPCPDSVHNTHKLQDLRFVDFADAIDDEDGRNPTPNKKRVRVMARK